MHNNTSLVEQRIARFEAERIIPAIYRDSAPVTISAWDVPDEPVPFAEARGQSFRPFAIGTPWSRAWGTTWFRVSGTVPAGWDTSGGAIELRVDLGFSDRGPGFQAEGLVYAPDGSIVKAIEPQNTAVPLTAGPGEDFELFIEAASNPDLDQGWTFSPTPAGDKNTASAEPIYTMRRLELGLRDVTVWELAQDVWTLRGLMAELESDRTRGNEILRGLERMVDLMDPDDVAGTAAAGREAIAPLLAAPASTSAHHVFAVGHAHIDSAWLWPVRETIRKCARTFSNVLALMDADPDFVFAASSAQQYAWMKQFYPELFARIAERVREGRFVPVGGMWVESDTNMPGGEALARQFVAGKGFFLREFGVEPREVWLPDSFGYTGAFPQIAVAAGAKYFLTQKISWNETNTFPHHTFRWEGIDGTRILTHFPPSNTYNSLISGEELARSERNYAEKGATNVSLLPFGHGDGGGGPTREMLAAAHRTRSLDGSPTVELGSPQAFFERAEAEYPNPPVWSGELYLEFHRGTYTSQARTKRGNRRSEHLLREAELWATTAAVRSGADYPYEDIESAWHTVLLQQFHDILPGSSIAWVHQQAEENYARVAGELEGVIAAAIAATGDGAGNGESELWFNAGPYPLRGVPALGAGVPEPADAATLRREGDDIVLENAALTVRIGADGVIGSVIERGDGRELVAPGGSAALLQVFRDTPNQWDAWDIDEHYRRNVTDLRGGDVSVIDDAGDGGVGVRVRHRFESSTITQEFSLSAGSALLDIGTEVDWHERQKLLKLSFDLDVHADRASSEVQFGHVERPTHSNTSWDFARFETSAHRWVHVAEHGFGVSVANDSTYGHDITRTTRDDGGTTTLVRESLLRAPLYPDPEADQGAHRFRTALGAGGIAEAVAAGYAVNLPPRAVTGAAVEPLLRSTNPAIVVEAVKLAEDRSGDVIVRLYEAHGGRASGDIEWGFPVASVTEADLLERAVEAPAAISGGDTSATALALRPFQLVTLRVARA